MMESIESLQAALAAAQRKNEDLQKEKEDLQKENEDLQRDLQRQKEELQRQKEDLQRENEGLEREKLLNFDTRLNFFARNAKGSHSYRSKSSGSTDGEKQKQKILTFEAKKNAKNIFTTDGGSKLRCVICRNCDMPGIPITVAHIVSSGMDDYSDFGVKNGYKDDLDVFSVRNFMPLCGTYGQEGTCHDAIDKHLIHISYDAFKCSYFLMCSPGAPESFLQINEQVLDTPPGWNPYHRLLAWRSRKCGTEYGFVPNFDQFEAMNKLSENSNSLGDAESDGADDENVDSDNVDN